MTHRVPNMIMADAKLDINGMEHILTQHVRASGVLTTKQLASLVSLNKEAVKPALESASSLALIQKVAGGWKAV